MSLSMSRPMARIPVPCIRRLCVGGLPHASGNVSRTAVQYSMRVFHIPAKSVSPLLGFRYGNRHPDGVVRLSRSMSTILVSVMTALPRWSLLPDGRRISPENGDSGVTVQQVAQGSRSLAEREARR